MKIKTILILVSFFLSIIIYVEYRSITIRHIRQKEADKEINSILLGYCSSDSCNCISGVAILKDRLSRINRTSFYASKNGRKIKLDDKLIFTKRSIDGLEITLEEYYNNTSVLLKDPDSCDKGYYHLILPDSLMHYYFNVTWYNYSE